MVEGESFLYQKYGKKFSGTFSGIVNNNCEYRQYMA